LLGPLRRGPGRLSSMACRFRTIGRLPPTWVGCQLDPCIWKDRSRAVALTCKGMPEARGVIQSHFHLFADDSVCEPVCAGCCEPPKRHRRIRTMGGGWHSATCGTIRRPRQWCPCAIEAHLARCTSSDCVRQCVSPTVHVTGMSLRL
jgi:hypothetical protein